jgi:ATP-dependent Clp protease ATP-binding subunit ClpB
MMSEEMEAMLEGGDFAGMMPFGMDMADNEDNDDDDSSDEGRAPSINLGSIFGNLKNFQKGDKDGNAEKVKDGREKKKADKHRKNLEAFCHNLTQKAKDGKIDRVIGRVHKNGPAHILAFKV